MHTYSIIEQGSALADAQKAIILLHGRGGSASNIIKLSGEFCDDSFYIAAPQATNNAWYPFTFLSPEEKNEPWLSSSLQIVKRLVDEISVHIPVERIYLMGFSQGACLALEFAGRFPAPYAGISAFSGGLIGDTVNHLKYTGTLDKTKIFVGSGDNDIHIPAGRVRESAEVFRKMGADMLLRIYPGMDHSVTREEIDEVRSFMFD